MHAWRLEWMMSEQRLMATVDFRISRKPSENR